MIIDNLHDAINYSKYVISADDIKIYRVIQFPNDRNLLQSDSFTRSAFIYICIKFNTSETRVLH